MDKNKNEDDKMIENINNLNSKRVRRLTPGKFSDSSNSEELAENNQICNTNDNTFFIYSSAMDTNFIWSSTSDSTTCANENNIEKKESPKSILNFQTNIQDSINPLFSSQNISRDVSLKPEQNYKFALISKDIKEFENNENNSQRVIGKNPCLSSSLRDVKENFSVEDLKKIMMNDSDSCGIRSVKESIPSNFQEGISNDTPFRDNLNRYRNLEWTSVVQAKTNVLYNKLPMWSISQNNNNWYRPTNYHFPTLGLNKIVNVSGGFPTQEVNNFNYVPNPTQSERLINIDREDEMKKMMLRAGVQKQMNELKGIFPPLKGDIFVSNPAQKVNIDNELLLYNNCKELIKQTVNQFKEEQRKAQEYDLIQKKFPDSQNRIFINELQKKRQICLQRMQELNFYYEILYRKLSGLEQAIMFSQRITGSPDIAVEKKFSKIDSKTCNDPSNVSFLVNKVGTMQVQSNKDFRLDVPEFIPGKKWHGFSKIEKENQNPILGNGSQSDDNISNDSYQLMWLFIQNLPSHVTVESIQKFFTQNNFTFIMPIHNNPFSRWMLLRFPNANSSRKALDLISGKVGQANLINDQEANIKLQELKNTIDEFMALQN